MNFPGLSKEQSQQQRSIKMPFGDSCSQVVVFLGVFLSELQIDPSWGSILASRSSFLHVWMELFHPAQAEH